MGAGLAGGPPCLPHSQVLMGAGLPGRSTTLPTVRPLYWDLFAGRKKQCVGSHSQVGGGWKMECFPDVPEQNREGQPGRGPSPRATDRHGPESQFTYIQIH